MERIRSMCVPSNKIESRLQIRIPRLMSLPALSRVSRRAPRRRRSTRVPASTWRRGAAATARSPSPASGRSRRAGTGARSARRRPPSPPSPTTGTWSSWVSERHQWNNLSMNQSNNIAKSDDSLPTRSNMVIRQVGNKRHPSQGTSKRNSPISAGINLSVS